MNVINVKLADLKPYEKNPRNNKDAVDYVVNSIKEFGFKVPLVIDKDNVIVCGHTRYLACKKLGIEEVPCVIADDLTEEQIKAYRLADNKVSDIATWDFELLNEELDNILNIQMSDFGFEELDNNFIDDLYNEQLGNPTNEAEEFAVTFLFDKSYEGTLGTAIKKMGKEYFAKKIIDEAEVIICQ